MVKFCNGSPCIFAGDFNSEPDQPLYNMISSGKVCQSTMNLLMKGKDYLDTLLRIREKVRLEFSPLLNTRSCRANGIILILGCKSEPHEHSDLSLESWIDYPKFCVHCMSFSEWIFYYVILLNVINLSFVDPCIFYPCPVYMFRKWWMWWRV